MNAAGERRPRQTRATEKKRLILEAAITLMLDKGLVSVTHRQVAHGAGVPVGSIGYYFNSRGELLLRAVEEIGARRQQRAAELIDAAAPACTAVLARDLVEIYSFGDSTRLLGWLGATVDCVRESEDLRLMLCQHRVQKVRDFRTYLEAAGRPEVSPELLVMLIDGALVRSAVEGAIGSAAVDTAVEALVRELDG